MEFGDLEKRVFKLINITDHTVIFIPSYYIPTFVHQYNIQVYRYITLYFSDES